MDFSKIPKFNPKRINRCYCYTNCWCDINAYNRPVPNKPNKSTTSTTKFVKIRNENGQLRPKCDRIPYSGLESLNSNSCSSHKGLTKSSCTTTSSNPSRHSSLHSIKSKSSNKDEFIKTSPHQLKWEQLVGNELTEPRQWYEQSKEQFWKARDCPTRNLLLTNFFTNPGFFLSQLDDRQITELNNFRLQNPKDCFNVLSKYTINKRLGYYDEKPPPQHICEFSFKLNERGLLEPSSNGLYFEESKHIRCRICGKLANVTDSNGIVPTAKNNQVQKIIVEVQNSIGNSDGGSKKAIKSKPGMRRKKMDEPGNSLALIYQKKY